MDEIRLRVVDVDPEHLRVEDVTNLVADQVDDRLDIQLLRQALLDTVDDRQLGVALLQGGVSDLQFCCALDLAIFQLGVVLAQRLQLGDKLRTGRGLIVHRDLCV